jgi:hypothetical protein
MALSGALQAYLEHRGDPSEELEKALLEAASDDPDSLLALAQQEVERASNLVTEGQSEEAARRMMLVRRILMSDESSPYLIADCEAVFLAASAPEVYMDIFAASDEDSTKEEVLRAVQVLLVLEQPLHLVASSLESASQRLLNEEAPKIALSASTRLLEIASKARSDFWQSVGHSCMARIYMDGQHVKKAIPHGEKLVLFAKKAELDPFDTAAASSTVASWHLMEGDPKRALGFALDAEKLMKAGTPPPELENLVYGVLASVYHRLRRSHLSEEYRAKEAEAATRISPLEGSPEG